MGRGNVGDMLGTGKCRGNVGDKCWGPGNEKQSALKFTAGPLN